VSVRVTLSKTIYPSRCIEEAVAAYSAICSARMIAETSYALEVEIIPVRGQVEQPDESRIAGEFLNYLLDLSLEHHLQTS
jgi:hypothetical protein